MRARRVCFHSSALPGWRRATSASRITSAVTSGPRCAKLGRAAAFPFGYRPISIPSKCCSTWVDLLLNIYPAAIRASADYAVGRGWSNMRLRSRSGLRSRSDVGEIGGVGCRRQVAKPSAVAADCSHRPTPRSCADVVKAKEQALVENRFDEYRRPGFNSAPLSPSLADREAFLARAGRCGSPRCPASTTNSRR